GNLHHAAGIACCHDVGPERRDIARFSLAELMGGLRLHEIVDTRTSAADLLLRWSQHFQPGNRPQDITRLRAHALRVRQVTGVVVDDPSLQWMTPGSWRTDLDEQFADVANAGRKLLGARRPGRVVAQQVAVLFHRRSTTGSVHDDAIDAGSLERVDQAACEPAGFVDPSGMKSQRATAPLCGGGLNRAPLPGEDVDGGGIHVRKHEPLYATGEESYFDFFHADC